MKILVKETSNQHRSPFSRRRNGLQSKSSRRWKLTDKHDKARGADSTHQRVPVGDSKDTLARVRYRPDHPGGILHLQRAAHGLRIPCHRYLAADFPILRDIRYGIATIPRG